jgi:hypothetical protein
MNKTVLTIVAAALLPMAAFAAPLGRNNNAPFNAPHFAMASAAPAVVLARRGTQPLQGPALCYDATAFMPGGELKAPMIVLARRDVQPQTSAHFCTEQAAAFTAGNGGVPMTILARRDVQPTPSSGADEAAFLSVGQHDASTVVVARRDVQPNPAQA